MKKACLPAIAAVTALASGAWAQSSLWDVQFSGDFNSPVAQSGAAAIGGSGNEWNLCLGGSGIQTLFNATGSSGSVNISWNSYGAATAPNGSGEYGFYGTADANLMRGYLYALGADTIAVSGLAALSDYTIYLYTQGDSASSGRELAVTTDLGTYTSSAAEATAGSFVEGQNYLVVSAETDAAGTMNLTYSPAEGEADVNGLQISGGGTVPEPGTNALLAVGAVAMVVVCRRAKKTCGAC
jgi:hypothetical protein